ncbi:MAG: hypothetical protein IPK82_23165 [Polyangiaceae bacterium]|nr:hypothetical protein [Polyangiaceae bacterium]
MIVLTVGAVTFGVGILLLCWSLGRRRAQKEVNDERRKYNRLSVREECLADWHACADVGAQPDAKNRLEVACEPDATERFVSARFDNDVDIGARKAFDGPSEMATISAGNTTLHVAPTGGNLPCDTSFGDTNIPGSLRQPIWIVWNNIYDVAHVRETAKHTVDIIVPRPPYEFLPCGDGGIDAVPRAPAATMHWPGSLRQPIWIVWNNIYVWLMCERQRNTLSTSSFLERRTSFCPVATAASMRFRVRRQQRCTIRLQQLRCRRRRRLSLALGQSGAGIERATKRCHVSTLAVCGPMVLSSNRSQTRIYRAQTSSRIDGRRRNRLVDDVYCRYLVTMYQYNLAVPD